MGIGQFYGDLEFGPADRQGSLYSTRALQLMLDKPGAKPTRSSTVKTELSLSEWMRRSATTMLMIVGSTCTFANTLVADH